MVSLSLLEISPSFPFPSHFSNSHTPLLDFTGIYPVANLCNTAHKSFLKKIAEGMAAVICIFEGHFQSFSTTTDILIMIMMYGNI